MSIPEADGGAEALRSRLGDAIQYETSLGCCALGDAAEVLPLLPRGCAQAIITSPPFALTRKKSYGNAASDEYVEWFSGFVPGFQHVLADDGSLVLEMGAAYLPGAPVKSLYQFKTLISLVEDHGMHLAQEFYWLNPARLPSPAQWVNIERVRVKDSVSAIWWLSMSERPKADNRRVLKAYSGHQQSLMDDGGPKQQSLRPSGHTVGPGFGADNGGAIPPNLLEAANTASSGRYLDACRASGQTAHPARWPAAVPEFFIRFLTDPGDLVIDPFAGSNTTGETAERMGRRWVAVESDERWIAGSAARFPNANFSSRRNWAGPARSDAPGASDLAEGCLPLLW